MYILSYITESGNFADTPQALASKHLDRPPIGAGKDMVFGLLGHDMLPEFLGGRGG